MEEYNEETVRLIPPDTANTRQKIKVDRDRKWRRLKDRAYRSRKKNIKNWKNNSPKHYSKRDQPKIDHDYYTYVYIKDIKR